MRGRKEGREGRKGGKEGEERRGRKCRMEQNNWPKKKEKNINKYWDRRGTKKKKEFEYMLRLKKIKINK